MTRTESDLHDVLTDRANQATDGASVLDWLDSRPIVAARPTRRHRIVLPLAAATVVVALVAVWLQVTSAAHSIHAGAFYGGISANTTEPTNKAFYAYAFTLDAVPGFGVQSRRVEPARQTIVYDQESAGRPDVIEAVIYRKGAFDPTTVRTGTTAVVNGKPGYYGPASGHVTSSSGRDSTELVASVAWRYAPDSWAVVNGVQAEFRDESHELAVARAVHPIDADAVRLAFRVGYLPAGLRTTRIDCDGLLPSTQADFARGRTGSTVHISVDYVPDQTVRAGFGTDKAPLTVGGNPAKLETLSEGRHVDGKVLEIIRDKYWVTVSGDKSISTEEMKSIALGLTLARNGADQGTWFTAKAALPH